MDLLTVRRWIGQLLKLTLLVVLIWVLLQILGLKIVRVSKLSQRLDPISVSLNREDATAFPLAMPEERPRNLILFIADGLGFAHLSLARSVLHGLGAFSKRQVASDFPLVCEGQHRLGSLLKQVLDQPVAVGAADLPIEFQDAPQPLDTHEVPLFGAIPAGPPADSQEQLEMFPVLRHLWGPDRYCLRLYHDSMEPTLKPGDIVLVHYRPDVNPEHVQGKVCACLVEGNPTLKRITVERRGRDRLIVLRGDNPDSPPMVVDGTADFSIQGVVISLVNRDL